MLYDSMFSWGHILQAFWRDTAAFVEAQERQSRQDFAHWMELWTTIVHNLTYSGRLPWAGSLELAEWSRTWQLESPSGGRPAARRPRSTSTAS